MPIFNGGNDCMSAEADKMLQCLYCTNAYFEPGKGSEEHVILSALGGRKSSRNVCCQNCNNWLGREIDEDLSKQFHFFCTMIGVTTGRGRDAPTHVKMLTSETEAYDLLPGGKSRLSDNKVEFDERENAATVSIKARDEKTALKLMDQALRKYGKSLDDIQSLEGLSVTGYPDQMHVRLSIGQECYRSIAKMALTYAATLISPKRLRDEEFFKITSFIKGECPSNDYVRIESESIFPQIPTLDDFHHRIFFFASTEKKQAISLLELFGKFRFSILLTDSWTGTSLAKVHVINPCTHERTDVDLQSSDWIFQEVQNLTDSQQIEAITNAIATVGGEINRRQRETLVSQIAAKAFNFKAGDPDRFLSEEELSKAFESISSDIARFITRSSVTEQVYLTAFRRDTSNSSENE